MLQRVLQKVVTRTQYVPPYMYHPVLIFFLLLFLLIFWKSGAKVQQKKKSPKNRATSEVFRKVFGRFSENSGSFSETFPMLYRLDRKARSVKGNRPKCSVKSRYNSAALKSFVFKNPISSKPWMVSQSALALPPHALCKCLST